MTGPSGTAEVHPRPLLARKRWVDLCGPWQFTTDPDDVGRAERWPERPEVFERTISVPFPPESEASGIGDRDCPSVVWYRRSFEAPQDEGERLLLHFGAVDYRAGVWVNGRLVGEHEGGHTPFACDVTDALVGAGEQVLVVRAQDVRSDPSQPRGKQDWLDRPHVVWYERTTGIWQPVWLEPVPARRIAALRWTPALDRGQLGLRVRLEGAPLTDLSVAVRLSLRGEPIAEDVYSLGASPILERDIGLDPVRIAYDRTHYLWSPEHPNLLDATVRLVSDGTVVDDVSSYVGLRSVGTGGGSFVLNGRPYFPRMVLAQNYWPESHLAAPSPDALRREVELVKQLGFNGVRIHQKVEDPRFLYWCDRLGVLAWGELPSAMGFGPDTVGRLTREWLEVLERDASCPSIVAWVPFNESWGVPHLATDEAQRYAVRALYALTKAVDPTRLVIGNDGWEHLVSDVFSVHDYATDPDVLRERYGDRGAVEQTLHHIQPFYRSLTLGGFARSDEPLMVTEFGGVSYAPGAVGSWDGYGTVASAEDLAKAYEGLVGALLDSPAVAGFCYTQLTDTAQERNGLLTEHRVPKLDVRTVFEINRRLSAAVPGDAISEIQSTRPRDGVHEPEA